MKRLFALYVLVLAFAVAGPAGARVLQSSDIARIVELEQPAISPDGKTVAVIAVTSDTARNTYDRELRAVDVATGRSYVLARGGDVTLPRWSHDGALAWLQREDGRLCIRRSGGAHPRWLACADGDVNDFAWRSDGAAIAFSAYDPPSKRDYFYAGDNDYTQTSLTPPVHLWIATFGDRGRVRRFTSGSWTVAPTDATGIFAPEFTWSPDGRRIVFARLPNTSTGDDEYSTLYSLDVASRQLTKLTQHSAVELAPSFSPDGRTVSYLHARDGNFLALTTLRTISGGKDQAVAPAFDRDVGGTIWLPDGAMLACGNDESDSRAWIVRSGVMPQPLDLGGLEITCDAYQSSTFDAGVAASVSRSGAIAFLATDTRHLRELYYLAPHARVPRRLTHVNAFLDGLTLGRIEKIAWNGPDGFREYGVVHYPPGMVAGKRYPIVVDIHGGPGLSAIASLAGASYGGDWPIAQLIAAHGYIVFTPNYRGSDNAGNAFLLAIVGDTVVGPSNDIRAGLDAVKALPNADPSRVAVCGWSYGGLLTSWLIGTYHDWRAAVSGAAVNVETQSYDLSVSNVQDRYYQNGITPYVRGGMQHYAAVSPITNAAAITTPTLIWGTTRDPVVPVTMSYALYHAMKDNAATVKFVVFDAATHGPDAPRNTRELTDLWIGWLDRYLRL